MHIAPFARPSRATGCGDGACAPRSESSPAASPDLPSPNRPRSALLPMVRRAVRSTRPARMPLTPRPPVAGLSNARFMIDDTSTIDAAVQIPDAAMARVRIRVRLRSPRDQAISQVKTREWL